MYQCELISVNKNTADFERCKAAEGEIAAVLRKAGIDLRHTAEVPADAKKLAVVNRSPAEESCDLFLFVNALNTTDNSSFRRLFYRLIASLESSIKTDDAHKGLTPKVKVCSLGDLGSGYKGYCFSMSGKRYIVLPCASLTGKDITELIGDALSRAEEVYAHSAEKYPEGIAYYDAKGNEADPLLNRDVETDDAPAQEKQSFFLSFIPLRRDSKRLKIRKTVVLVAIAAFIGALIYVLDFYIFAPMQNNAVTSEIQEIAYSGGAAAEKEEGAQAQDWDALKKVNDEIVGWITIPDTVIDYPVLEHKGDDRYNQYYIKRTYKKESSEYGSIFLDYRSTDGADSRNVIMHGHDMIDGSMFAGLMKYSPKGDLKGDLDYYKSHPVITFNTPKGDAKYKIISVFKTSTRYEHGEFFNYMQGEFNSDAEFMNFVYNMRIRSMFNIPVTCNEGDQIITLSTCCYEFYQWRCVVVARKVRPGEDESVDVNLASLNPAPLFPDVYYERYGGTRPDPGTFKSANAEGKVDWYDGKGNLEGSEDLTATLASNPTQPPTEKPKKGATEPKEIVYYPVTFRNYDGSQFAAYNVREGDPLPIPEEKPVMPEDDFYTYRFDGWSLDIEGVNLNALNVGVDIYPIFTPVAK